MTNCDFLTSFTTMALNAAPMLFPSGYRPQSNTTAKWLIPTPSPSRRMTRLTKNVAGVFFKLRGRGSRSRSRLQ